MALDQLRPRAGGLVLQGCGDCYWGTLSNAQCTEVGAKPQDVCKRRVALRRARDAFLKDQRR